MIVAERKPLEEILRLIDGAKTVLLTGCGGCVTVHMAGGEKEVEVLASLLRLHYKKEDKPIKILTQTVTRQCEPEYVRELADNVDKAAVVLSMGCGVGVQFIAENFPKAWVVPALNTKFAGATLEAGVWAERCGLCGECILYKTGGICPVIRCSKSLLNGPCGGSQNGKCEVDPEIDCAWQLIHDRMKDLGKLDLLLEIEPPKDWSKARDGGPRKVMREDMRF
ncbi:MAG: methylenetetrahydrofolate reductase C-terminal domain-containing protein [Firmicutes bacterium]|nr:methylenetetrahydrofolate reductase C-terminal domain-containing protein [Bacillota bacterium]MCL5039463.1 methylenetetrahydrofolate reductase C-terminal domain-containing protein [Bacillota bacterium]